MAGRSKYLKSQRRALETWPAATFKDNELRLVFYCQPE
jgi:hypothetical protein